MIVIFVIVGVGLAFPDAGAAMLGGFIGFWVGVYVFFFVTPTWISVVIAAVGTAGLFILVTFRKYFFKQKVSGITTSTANPILQSQLMQTNPFNAPQTGVVIAAAPGIDPSKTEVTSTA